MVTIRCNDKPWYDNKIRKESRKCDRLKRKALKSNTELSWTNYKKCRNKVNNMIKEAKLRFFEKLELSDFRFNDQSQFWKTVKLFMKGNYATNIPPLVINDNFVNHDMAISDEDKASVLNEYFTSISCLQHIPDSLPDFLPRTDVIFNDINISEDEVKDSIMILQLNKASGSDGISNRLLK